MKEIEIGNSKRKAIVDDEDYDMLISHATSWSVSDNILCRSNITKRTETMARLILGLQRGGSLEGDHIDGNIFDNRKLNLRSATRSQNQANKRKFPNTISKYRGVQFDKGRKKLWKATISKTIKYKAQKTVFLGRFEIEEEAARAYDKAAKEYFGEFARLNFP